LGYLISTEGIAPHYEYLVIIRAWTKHAKRDRLRAFLGLLSFLSMFSFFAFQVLRSLQSLWSQKRAMDEWSPEYDECFEGVSQFSMDKSFLSSMKFPLRSLGITISFPLGTA